MSGAYTLIKRSDIRSGESERRTFGTDSLITGEGHGHFRPNTDKTERNHKKKKKTASKMAKQSRKRNRG